jgi:hypothetical protein
MSSTSIGYVPSIIDTMSNVEPVTPRDPVDPSKNPKKVCFLETVKKVIDTFKEKIWAFAKECVKIASCTLKIMVGIKVIDPEDTSRISQVAKGVNIAIGALGLTSFVSMLVNFVSIPFSAKSAVEKGMIGDAEGGVLSGADAVMGAVETIGDMGSGVSALAALGAIPFVVAFSIIALPFAIAGLGYGIGKGVYTLAHNAKFLHDMRMIGNQEVTASKADALKKYIDGKLKVTEDDIREEQHKITQQKGITGEVDISRLKETLLAKRVKKQESIFKRRADPKMVELMKKLRVQLDAKNAEETAELALEHIKGFMWRKIGISSIGLVGNVTLLATLIASLAMPVMSPIVMPIVGGVKAVLGIGKAALGLGLESWHDKWYESNKGKFAAAAA